MSFQYFTEEYAIQIHDEIIKNSGGALGILNLGLLKSSLWHVQNDLYYPELEDKLTHLFYSINKNHAFNDGNKRSSIALSAYFMELNGLGRLVPKFTQEMENIAVYVADNLISRELLFEIIESLMNDVEYSEVLKLKLIDALKNAVLHDYN